MLRSRLLAILLIGAATALSIHVLVETCEGLRLDLTADDLYSLTPGTVAILARMHDEGLQPVAARLYFSATAGKTLPRFIKDFITYERYLRTLLGEIERAARGKIELSFVDPVPDSDEAQDALDYGLEGKPIHQSGDPFFFGLVMETRTGNRQVIPFLWPDRQEGIEYEITRRLHSLLWPQRKSVALLAGLPVAGSGDNPFMSQLLAAQGKRPREKWLAIERLEEAYRVETLAAEVEHLDPAEFDLVVAIHPKELPEKTLFALDEWIVRGGHTLILVDPYAIEDEPPATQGQPWLAFQHARASGLERLFSTWGLAQPADQFAADLELAVRRATSRLAPPEAVVVDLAFDGRALAAQTPHPVFQGVGSLRLFTPGVLAATALAPGLEATPLLATSAAGRGVEIRPGFGEDGLHYPDLGNPGKLKDALARAATAPAPVLAYLLQGTFPTAFPAGVDLPVRGAAGVAAGGEAVHRAAVAAAERRPGAVLVLADTDWIADPVAFQQNLLGVIQPANDNAKLFLNAVDFLAGSPELMQVRAKGRMRRPFTRFDEIEAAAERDTFDRERQIRGAIERFEAELREKQNEVTRRNAALLQKKIRDEVDRLNERIREGNRELRSIRRERRAALAGEEDRVRWAVMGWMPSLVLALGIVLSARRRWRARGAARRS